MGGGGGSADDKTRREVFKQHDKTTGAVSVLGCDGKRYAVDESTSGYFYEIEALVEKEPENPEAVEERQILAGRAPSSIYFFQLKLCRRLSPLVAIRRRSWPFVPRTR